MTTIHNTVNTNQDIIEQVKQEKSFYLNLLRYLAVISMLFIINYMTLSTISWAMYPAIFWGIAIVFQGLKSVYYSQINDFLSNWEAKKIKQKTAQVKK